MWNFIRGYVIIELDGLRLENFLSQLKKSGIAVLYVNRSGYCKMTIAVSCEKRVIALAETSGIRHSVKGRRGLAALSGVFKARPMLIAGAMFIIAVVAALSSVCFNIEVSGLNSISEFAFCGVLAENGIKAPLLKAEINTAEVEELIYEKYPEIAYVDAKIKGASLILTVMERGDIPETMPDYVSSLVAEKDGYICDVTVYQGRAAVEPGAYVKKGDILISGDFESSEKRIITAAKGEVKAQVKYDAEAEIVYDTAALCETGRTSMQRIMRIGKREFVIYGENPYEHAVKNIVDHVSLGENSPLLLEITDIEWREATVATDESKLFAAVISAKEKAFYKALEDIPEGAQIINFTTDIRTDGDITNAHAVIITIEDITERQAISGGDFFGDTAEDMR